MNAPAAHVVPLFATPFGVVTVPGGEALNAVLVPLFHSRATAEWRDSGAVTRPEVFRSRDDLFDWPDAPVKALAQAMLAGIGAVVFSINSMEREQFNSLRMESRAWFTLVRPDGYEPSANHPNTAWTALYCVAAPPIAGARIDSGVLRLHETRLGTSFPDATNSDTVMPYRPGHSTWRPVPGQMAVFPGAVTHEIALLRSAGELALVTARVRYVGPAQSGLPWW